MGEIWRPLKNSTPMPICLLVKVFIIEDASPFKDWRMAEYNLTLLSATWGVVSLMTSQVAVSYKEVQGDTAMTDNILLYQTLKSGMSLEFLKD